MSVMIIPSHFSLSKHTNIRTNDACKYLHRLCRHFGHKVEASWNSHKGVVRFEDGMSCFWAGDEELRISCYASSGNTLNEITETVERHFLRFSKSEDITLNWNSTDCEVSDTAVTK